MCFPDDEENEVIDNLMDNYYRFVDSAKFIEIQHDGIDYAGDLTKIVLVIKGEECSLRLVT